MTPTQTQTRSHLDARLQALARALDATYPAVFWLDPGPEAPADATIRMGFAHEWATARGGEEPQFLTDLEGKNRLLWLDHEFAGQYPEDRGNPVGVALDPAAWLSVKGSGVDFCGPEAATLRALWEGTRPDAGASTFTPPRSVTSAWRQDSPTFTAVVAACQEATADGTFAALCPTNQLQITGVTADLETYLHLRTQVFAAAGGFIRYGQRTLLSASPEQFFATDPDGRIWAEPIKGTRQRGARDDEATKVELSTDPKELAENGAVAAQVARELTPVCVDGTVNIHPPVVRSFTHVHQLIGQVEGKLAVPTAQVLQQMMPVASMLGAPKAEAFAFTRELEGAPRGGYSGCFGWLGADGAADLRVTIRSAVGNTADEHLRIGVGAGVIAQSVVAAEVAETAAKAQPLLQALGGGAAEN